MSWKPQAKHFPEGSFLNLYMTEQLNIETAYVYDFWCGLWLLSLAAGRNVIVRPGAPVFLNLYIVLAAESGVTRKSTAVRVARKLGKQFASALSELGTVAGSQATVPVHSPISSKNPLRFVENKSSAEFLLQSMERDSHEYGACSTAIAVDEMVTVFGSEKYVRHVPALLTDLYDCPDDREGGGLLKLDRPRQLRNVWFGLLTASAPSWLMRTINPDVIEGGFTSRTLFVWEEQPKKDIPWPNRPPPPNLVPMLLEVRSKCDAYKEIKIYDKARTVFERWYKSRHRYRDPYRASFQSREDGHVLCVAALLAINDGTYKIDVSHIRYAIRCIDHIATHGAELFSGINARTTTIIGLDRLRDALLSAGSDAISRSKLTLATRNYLKNEEMLAALEIMKELKLVQEFIVDVDRGRPTTLYRATKLMTKKGVIDAITERMD